MLVSDIVPLRGPTEAAAGEVTGVFVHESLYGIEFCDFVTGLTHREYKVA